MDRNDCDNLENRINAAKRSDNYNERCFVDVPIQHASFLLRFYRIHSVMFPADVKPKRKGGG